MPDVNCAGCYNANFVILASIFKEENEESLE